MYLTHRPTGYSKDKKDGSQKWRRLIKGIHPDRHNQSDRDSVGNSGVTTVPRRPRKAGRGPKGQGGPLPLGKK